MFKWDLFVFLVHASNAKEKKISFNIFSEVKKRKEKKPRFQAVGIETLKIRTAE